MNKQKNRVLLVLRASSGRILGICDSRCYNAEGTQCNCICGGRNHRKGLKQSVENVLSESSILINSELLQQSLFSNSTKIMKRYIGTIVGGECQVTVQLEGENRPLEPHLDRLNKSPTGYAWGYGGSGPAQLAFAILMDCFCDEVLALSLFQKFKFKVISNLDRNEDWVLSETDIRKTIAALIDEDPQAIQDKAERVRIAASFSGSISD